MKSKGWQLGALGIVASLAAIRVASRTRDSAEKSGTGRAVIERVTERVTTRNADQLAPLDNWPVLTSEVTRIGDDAAVVRKQNGPHGGIDIMVPAGAVVIAPEDMRVIRVKDGTGSTEEQKKRAGVWVDGRGRGGRVLRFLHLAPGSVTVAAGQQLQAGEPLAKITADIQPPHLHFEVRRSDWAGTAYGAPINPVLVLPNEGSTAVLQRLARLREQAQRGVA